MSDMTATELTEAISREARKSQTISSMRIVAAILKRRFPNLTVEETIELSGEISLAVMFGGGHP